MDGRERRRFGLRARFVSVSLLLGLGLVVARAAELQLHQHEELSRLARSQYLSDVQVPARRGRIHDRSGKDLAISVDVPSVYANPSAITDPRAAARALAPVLGQSRDSIYQKLVTDRLFVWLKRQVSPEVESKVRALGLAGVGLTTEPRRFYPNREVASQVLGFTGVDARGLEGIERAFDDVLTGEPQVVAALRDGRGRAVLPAGLDPDARSRGADVTLSLDIEIQHAAEVALARSLATTHARSGMAVVLDVPTAEVLAMAVAPDFNPNLAADAAPDRRRNRALTDVFEPGSTLKPLVIGAALEARAVRPDATFFCENGAWTIGSHVIHDTHSYATLSLGGIIQKSSNIGAAKVGQALGRERLSSALKAYGFGQRTGVRFPGEVAGILREPSAWSEVNVATISFGHGIAVTALQLAAAYRALAAEGRWRAPVLVRSVQSSDGETLPSPAGEAERAILSPATVQRVRTMLEAAVGPEGTGQLAQVLGFRVAGKTGTANKIDPVAGGYSSDEVVAVFAGFLPAQAPRVVIVVSLDNPQGQRLAGSVAAPVFAEIAAASMRTLGVLPTEPLSAPAVVAAAPSEEAPHVVVDDERPAATAPARPGAMPSFVGLTAREVVHRFADLGEGLELAMQGSGRVVRQEPPAGTDRVQAHRLSLTLE